MDNFDKYRIERILDEIREIRSKIKCQHGVKCPECEQHNECDKLRKITIYLGEILRS